MHMRTDHLWKCDTRSPLPLCTSCNTLYYPTHNYLIRNWSTNINAHRTEYNVFSRVQFMVNQPFSCELPDNSFGFLWIIYSRPAVLQTNRVGLIDIRSYNCILDCGLFIFRYNEIRQSRGPGKSNRIYCSRILLYT